MKNENIDINFIRSNTFANKNRQYNLEENILEEILPEKIAEKRDTKMQNKIKQFYDDKSITKVKNESYFINGKKSTKEPDISSIIKNKLYHILLENEYIALINYFIFKKLIIGMGKYGTVWIGLNIKEANFVSIKSQHNEKDKNILSLKLSFCKN